MRSTRYHDLCQLCYGPVLAALAVIAIYVCWCPCLGMRYNRLMTLYGDALDGVYDPYLGLSYLLRLSCGRYVLTLFSRLLLGLPASRSRDLLRLRYPPLTYTI